MGGFRIDPQGLTVGLDGIAVAIRIAVSDSEVVPGPGMLGIDPQGLTVGFDGIVVAIEVAVSVPEVVPGLGSSGLIRRAWR